MSPIVSMPSFKQQTINRTRLEAFSCGVLAFITTIKVFYLKIQEK
jgi:uncharacterized membrane protein